MPQEHNLIRHLELLGERTRQSQSLCCSLGGDLRPKLHDPPNATTWFLAESTGNSVRPRPCEALPN